MENVIYMNGFNALSEWEHYLVDIYCANVSVAFENIYLNNELESTQQEIIYTMGEITETRSTGNRTSCEKSCRIFPFTSHEIWLIRAGS